MPSLENNGLDPLPDHTDASSTRGDFTLDNEQISESQGRDANSPEWDLGLSDRYAELRELGKELREWARANGFDRSYALDKGWLPAYESQSRISPRYSLLNKRLGLSYTSLPETAAERQRVYERIVLISFEITVKTKIGLYLGAVGGALLGGVGALPGAVAGATYTLKREVKSRLKDVVRSQLETGDFSLGRTIESFFGIQRTDVTVPEIREEYSTSQPFNLDQPSPDLSQLNRTISRTRQFRGK